MLQDVWRLGAAKLVLTHDGRIAVLNFSGLLTRDVLSGLIRQASDAYGDHTAGWVSDFTQAALAVPLEDLLRITLGTPPAHVLRRPGAFIVPQQLAPVFREHAAVLARATPPILRQTYQRRAPAVLWVSRAVAGNIGGGRRETFDQEPGSQA